MDKTAPANPRLGLPMAALLRGALLGLVLVVAVLLSVTAWRGRAAWPEITPDRLQQARQQWQQAAPSDYDIQIQVRGRQPATYRVEVRGGDVQAAFRDGHPVKQRRVWGTWSVPGMFGTIARDLEHIGRVERGQADPHTPRLTVRGRFHPQFGYPERYQRIQWGTDLEVNWEVTQFTTPAIPTSPHEH